MAIGSPGKAARLDQLRTFAKVEVWSGFHSPHQVRADVCAAVLDEVKDAAEAQRLAEGYLSSASEELAAASSTWPAVTEFDRLQAALGDLAASDIVVLQACDDHWEANEALQARATEGRPPRGIAYFTHTDVWHAVEHGMLEVNVWHGDSANVGPTDGLLTEVIGVLEQHGLAAHFDEGRIEVSVRWERRLRAYG